MRYLFHLPLSPFCRKVRLALAEKRLPFELRIEKVWERRSDYLDMNPAGTVPTMLEDNGLAVPGSSVICEFLEEAYPDVPLLGQSRYERVEVRRTPARCGKAMPACGNICRISAGWRKPGATWPAAAFRWPISPPPPICQCWISPVMWIGRSARQRATGMRKSSPDPASARCSPTASPA